VRVVGVVYICYRQLFFLSLQERERETISFFPIICSLVGEINLLEFFLVASKRFF